MPETLDTQNISTKERIFNVAVRLFSDCGYKEVSMRDIARGVAINVSSLYNHFASKEDILKTMYAFYATQWQNSCPDIDGLLILAETEPPHEVLMKLDFRFDPSVQETMNRIVKIALQQIFKDPESEKLIKEHILEGSASMLSALLNRMTELGRIEKMDVRAVAHLISSYSISAALFNNTSLQVGPEEWRTGLGLLFSLVKPA